MIPLRLVVRNFLCYGEGVPPLPLEGFHISCLSGDNGSGKTALLDAMTWALWGEARGRKQEELVRHGQPEMAVELDFEVGGQRYRVARRYVRGQGGRTERTFCFLHLLHNSTPRLMAEGVTEAEARLRHLLKMDYDTFINTSFLRQGRADEFTLKKPAEKREILGEILGLKLYTSLEERAKLSARYRREQAGQLSAHLQRLEEEIRLLPGYQAELEQVEASLKDLQAQGAALDARRQALRSQVEALAREREALAQKERLQEGLEKGVWEEEEKAQGYRGRLEECQGVLSGADAIEQGFQRLSQALGEEAELNGKLLQLLDHQKRAQELRSAIEAARLHLEGEEKTLRREIARLEVQAAREEEFTQALQQAQADQERLQGREAALSVRKERCQALAAALARQEAEAQGLRREIAEMREKEGLLSQEGARCPLCLTELGEEGLGRLRQSYQEGIHEKSQTLDLCLQEGQRGEGERAHLQGEADREEKALKREQEALQRRIGALTTAREEAGEARSQAGLQGQEVEAVVRRLREASYAHQEQDALRQIEAAIAALDYRRERHQAVRGEVEALNKFQGQKQQLAEARRLLLLLAESLSQAEAALRQKRQELAELAQEIPRLRAEVASLPQLRQELEGVQGEYQQVASLRDKALGQQGDLQGKIEGCRRREGERKTVQEELKAVQREESLYHRLAEAFSKTGVPALIVEDALRELEEEADGLLKRLSGGRMSLRFETQRPKEGGGVVEALEVKIADEQGTRNYEMFSGGEAFRINFALRVALSRLLSRRAGSPLRLLIVDEGFGTQDTQGREKLIEAINAVSPDFDRIIVITHLEEMKELFPVRIEITKTPQGSTWSLSL